MKKHTNYNEYYMPREYYEEPKEYQEPGKHIGAMEYMDATEQSEGTEFFGEAQAGSKEHGNGIPGRRSKLRKMAYLLASSVAVVSVATAAIPEKSLTMIPAGQYSEIGYSHGGVIPVKDREGWHLLRLNGEKIYDVGKTANLLGHPNEDGWTAYQIDGTSYVVLDGDGREVWSYRTSDMAEYGSNRDDRIFVTDENYAVIPMHDWQSCVFTDDKGNIIYDDIAGLSMYQCAEFSEGYALICDDETDTISLLGMDGSLTQVYEKDLESNRNPQIQIIDAYADGKFVFFAYGDYVLYDVAMREAVWIPRGLSEEEAASLGGVRRSHITSYVRYAGEGVFSAVPSAALKRYTRNNVSLAHNGTYYCQTYSRIDEEGQSQGKQDFLFDASRRDDANLLGLVACYDTIYFDDSAYLLVCEDDEYFYIDWDGNVVSKTYQKATTFSDQGYALVMDQEGWAYVLDENLKQVDRIADVTDLEVQAKGDILEVICGEERFICYYGVNE